MPPAVPVVPVAPSTCSFHAAMGLPQLAEDNETNRMTESLTLYELTCRRLKEDGVAHWCCVPHSMFGTASNCANIMNCHSGEVDREIRRLDFQSLDSRRRQFHVEIFFTVHMVIVNDQQKEIPMSCFFQHIATVLGMIDEHAVRFAGIRVVFGIVGPRSYFCCLCGRIFFREGWVCKFIFVFRRSFPCL